LRSGARAPDCPFVILVRLRLPSNSLGRIDGARHVCTTRAGLRVWRNGALPGRGMAEGFASPAQTGRAGGRV